MVALSQKGTLSKLCHNLLPKLIEKLQNAGVITPSVIRRSSSERHMGLTECFNEDEITGNSPNCQQIWAHLDTLRFHFQSPSFILCRQAPLYDRKEDVFFYNKKASKRSQDPNLQRDKMTNYIFSHGTHLTALLSKCGRHCRAGQHDNLLFW